MNRCARCGNDDPTSIIVHTETITLSMEFGHINNHVSFVRCELCGKEGQKAADLGVFSKVVFLQAVKNWNLENPEHPKYYTGTSTHGDPYIECLTCHRKSYNLNDINYRYCGFCNVFHDG